MLSLPTNKRCASAPSFVLVAFLLSAPLWSEAATVELKQISDPAGIVNQTAYPATATEITSVSAPATSSDYSFTHWTLSGVRQEDDLGRSLNPFAFLIYENTTIVAHYLLTDLDSDDDGIADWYEIEFYGDLLQSSISDTDEDGVDLFTEKFRGYHPNLVDTLTEGGISRRRSGLVEYNRGFYQLNEESIPLGIVSRSAYFETNSTVSLSAPPMESSGYYFTGWFVGSERIDNSFSVHPISITMTGDVTVVARYIEGLVDSDADGLVDWYEQFHFNGLDESLASDVDADQIPTETEKIRGYNPNLEDSLLEGGVSRRRSLLTDVNLAGFSSYELVSDPAGLVQARGTVPDGTVVSTPDLWHDSQSGYTFAYWDLDGIRQQDAFGMALGGFSFSVTSDVVAVAHYLSADEDADLDGIFDWIELNYYSDLTNTNTSDTDIDEFDFAEEVRRGYNPLFVDTLVEGGISRRRSRMAVVNFQPFERVKYVQVDGVLTNFFTTAPSFPDGFVPGTNTAPVAGDWDGDGDLDLFVFLGNGTPRIYENIGSKYRWNLTERNGLFSGIDLANATPALGDWDGDGRADLVVGLSNGVIRLLGSSGLFTEETFSTDYLIDSGSVSAIPALGDVTGDGLVDLLVLRGDGQIRMYPNQNSPGRPFDEAIFVDNWAGIQIQDGTGLSLADTTLDGISDLLVSDAQGRIWEFRSSSVGQYNLHSKVWGGTYAGFANRLTLATGDLDGDGDLDAIGGFAEGGLVFLRNPKVGFPADFKAFGGAGSIRLTWSPSRSFRLKGYTLYRATDPAGPFVKLTSSPIPVCAYMDTNVIGGATYFYYVTTVSEYLSQGSSIPKEVESIPSEIVSAMADRIYLWMADYFGKPGQTAVLQLNVEHGTGISGNLMDIGVSYDPSVCIPLAQFDGSPSVKLTPLTETLSVSNNELTATGELRITGTGGTVIGDGHLFDLYFHVQSGIPAGWVVTNAFTSVSLQSSLGVQLNVDSTDTAILTVTEGGYFAGDINGDGVLDMGDHALLMDLLKKGSRSPTPEEIAAGDMNGNGRLDHRDISLLLRLIHGN